MSNENTRGEHHTKYSLGETGNDPMPFREVLDKVGEGCRRYMYLLDEEGDAECDDYIVALHFFDTWMETLNNENN